LQDVGLQPEDMRHPSAIGILTCLWIALVVFLSFLPVAYKEELHTRGRFHFLGHGLVFFVTGFLLMNITSSLRNRLFLLIFALVFGFSIELAQHLAFQIGFEQSDVLTDSVGILCGVLIAVAMERLVLQRQLN
jgi:glycopeptide antibiotics resistance protein